jgi:hypothetical protein
MTRPPGGLPISVLKTRRETILESGSHDPGIGDHALSEDPPLCGSLKLCPCPWAVSATVIPAREEGRTLRSAMAVILDPEANVEAPGRERGRGFPWGSLTSHRAVGVASPQYW